MFDISVSYTGQTDVNPNIVKITTSDSYDTITTAGWLVPANIAPIYVNPLDILFVDYNYNVTTSPPANFGIFQPVYNNGVITLVPTSGTGSVNLPVVSGHFANFQGTSGTIGDNGFVPTNASLTKVVMAAAGTYTSGNILVSNDANGSLRPGVGVQATQINSPTGPTIGTTIAFTAGNTFGSPVITSGIGYGMRGEVSASGMGGTNVATTVLSGVNGYGSFSGVSTGYGEYSSVKGELSIGTLAIASTDIVSPFISDLGEPSDNPSGSLINMTNYVGINRTSAVAGSYMNFFGAATNLMILNQNGTPGYLTSAGSATPSGTARQMKIEADGTAFYVLGYTNPYT
jgi:hypothetical protein